MSSPTGSSRSSDRDSPQPHQQGQQQPPMPPMLPGWPPMAGSLPPAFQAQLQQFQLQQVQQLQRQLALHTQQLQQQQQHAQTPPHQLPGQAGQGQISRLQETEEGDRKHHRVWEQDNGAQTPDANGTPRGQQGLPPLPWTGDGAAAAVAAAAAAVQAAAAAVAAANMGGEDGKKKRPGEDGYESGDQQGGSDNESSPSAHPPAPASLHPSYLPTPQGKIPANINELIASGRLPFNPLMGAALANANRLPYLLAAAAAANADLRQQGGNPFFPGGAAALNAIRAAAQAQLAAGGHGMHDPTGSGDVKHPTILTPLTPLTLLPHESLGLLGGSPGSTPGSAESRRKRRPSRLYTCNYPGCNKQFTRNFNLQSHAKTHDPDREKPFVCPECSKGFWRKVDLERHDTVHTKVKGHQCPRCDKKFTRKDALQRHVGAKRCAAVKGLAGLLTQAEDAERGISAEV
ncbi:hypothetical protein HDV00_004948 [Rhizophlyctis rosea]|nr:hypothetical protein HDV00_004948 [Rhizophlyctis rosea]